MKKVIISVLCLLMILSVMPITANAAGAKVDRVSIQIDVPVDGVKLPKNASVEYFCDAQKAMFPTNMPPMKVDSVAWYKVNSGTPLAKDYKAKLGEEYTLTVILVPQDGYECASSLQTADNKINNISATVNCYGSKYWAFSVDFTTIPSVSGKPVITVKKLNLTPYEGEPVEFMIEATGTNLKYQWQIGWIDGSWTPMVDIDDNAAYRGSKTNHFKIHTFYGDSFDQNGLDVRCLVKSDSGEAYSQVFNFTFIDCTVVDKIDVTGLSVPVCSEQPDLTASTSAKEYSVSKVEWYGPKGSDGEYQKMNTNEVFTTGEYFCRLHITPDRAYRFDENTTVKVNGTNQKLNMVDGSGLNPYGADLYYVDVPFTAQLNKVDRLSANVTSPVAGAYPNETVTPAGEGYKTTDVDWSYYNEKYDEYYIMPDGMTFEAGKSYECAVQFEAFEEYVFADKKEDMVGYINGIKGSVSSVYSNKKAYVTVKFTMPQNEVELGDANNDGTTDVSDVTAIQMYLAGYDQEINEEALDINGDGTVDVNDVTALQMILAGYDI